MINNIQINLISGTPGMAGGYSPLAGQGNASPGLGSLRGPMGDLFSSSYELGSQAGGSTVGEGFSDLLLGMQANYCSALSATTALLGEMVLKLLEEISAAAQSKTAKQKSAKNGAAATPASLQDISSGFLGGASGLGKASATPSFGTSGGSAPSSGGGAGGGDNSVGMKALGFGVDSPAINPNTGDSNWNLWCLGWVNQAIQSAGGGAIPELQSEDAQAAYEKALANGKIHHGHPPGGAIVFFPGIVNPANGHVWGHVGIANSDGKTYRGTVPASENAKTIGDRPIPNIENVAWMSTGGEGSGASSAGGDSAAAEEIAGGGEPAAGGAASGAGQAKASGGEIPDFGPTPSKEQIGQMLEAAAARYGIPPDLLKAVAWQESDWTVKAVSFDGGHGKGIMQIDDRYHDLAKTDKVWDPKINIDYGAKYLADLFHQYGTWDLALLHYNGGADYPPLVRKHMQNKPWQSA